MLTLKLGRVIINQVKNICYFKFVAYFVFCSLSLVFSSPVFSVVDLTDISTGARPLGMGNSYAGGLDDATAIFTNPAAKELVMKKFPKFWAKKAAVIPHCFNAKDYPEIQTKDDGRFVISHIGAFYKIRNPEILFKALKRNERRNAHNKNK